MTSFERSDDLAAATFTGVDLRGARFTESDLSGVVMRGVEVRGADIDAPWLSDGDGPALLVNGVDVGPFVEAELDRLFPGRDQRRAHDPAALQAAWEALQASWDTTLAEASGLPDGAVDVQVAGEWSFAQTLRHLVLATDMWLGLAVLGEAEPFHPLGLRDTHDGDTSEAVGTPAYSAVLEARADRVGKVRDFLAAATPALLDEARANPHEPSHAESVRSCLHVILEEEWEHLRFARRDLAQVVHMSARH